MTDWERNLIRKGIYKERIEQEMSWLRCIDMDKDKDVRRAAIEIILSQIKE